MRKARSGGDPVELIVFLLVAAFVLFLAFSGTEPRPAVVGAGITVVFCAMLLLIWRDRVRAPGVALRGAIERGDAEAIGALLDARPDFVRRPLPISGARLLPLHYAAMLGRLPAARALLARGAAVDERDRDGKTALHHAARHGRATMSAYLLAHGADVNARAERGGAGGTPLHVAVQAPPPSPIRLADPTDYVDTLHILLAGGADVRARDASGSTPLEILARWAGPNDRDERDATAAGAYRALERLLRDAGGA